MNFDVIHPQVATLELCSWQQRLKTAEHICALSLDLSTVNRDQIQEVEGGEQKTCHHLQQETNAGSLKQTSELLHQLNKRDHKWLLTQFFTNENAITNVLRGLFVVLAIFQGSRCSAQVVVEVLLVGNFKKFSEQGAETLGDTNCTKLNGLSGPHNGMQLF